MTLSLCVALAATLAQPLAGDTLGVEGYWTGWAERGGIRSELSLHLASSGNGISGTFDAPAMGYIGASIISARLRGDSVRISLPLPLGSLRLIGDHEHGVISGTLDRIERVAGEWKSLGVHGAFELRRGVEPVRPYRVEPVTIRNGDVALGGSVYMPTSAGPHPAAVFIAGSGDALRTEGGFIADRLARAGIATLVYDKRGVGESSGNWHDVGFDALAADAEAALAVLRTRSGVDSTRAGFVCQSQGCWIAPVALNAGGQARFIAAISGPAVTTVEEDLDHYRQIMRQAGYGDADIREVFEVVRVTQRYVLGEATRADVAERIDRYQARPWFRLFDFKAPAADEVPDTFSRKWLEFDPQPHLDALRVPTLWLFGTADVIIPVDASVAALRLRAMQPSPSIIMLPGAGHALSVEGGEFPRLADGFPDAMIEWIRARQ